MSMPAMLAARAHREGRAQRTAQFRHRALAPEPLGIVVWQLGAEPYTIAAIGGGTRPSGFDLFVPGFPLNRDLLFAAMKDFAEWFCPAFEASAAGPCEETTNFGEPLQVPDELPQIVVPNRETIGVLGRLGRRLAYLPIDGPQPADPLLPRLGKHLMWIADYAATPGQQLIVAATQLIGDHYQTAMSTYETASLPALDAWIDPPTDTHAFHAAARAEQEPIGPRPERGEGDEAQRLMRSFNVARAGSTDRIVVERLLNPIRAFYQDLVDGTWELMWRSIERERQWPEAPSVVRRSYEDRRAFASHIAWMNGPAQGRRRTRRVPRAAAMELGRLESAQARCAAEEAIDDPLRMAPVLLSGKAVAGEVAHCDNERRENVNGRNVKRPSVILNSSEPCAMPVGKYLWWSQAADKREWRVERIEPNDTGGSTVTLILQTNRLPPAGLPVIGTRACFSELRTGTPYALFLPTHAPWTHRPADAAMLAPSTDLEDTDIGQEEAA
jgi:hypothetical protein